MVIVPGGIQSTARLMGGATESPDDFVVALNRTLLRTVAPNQDWRHNRRRVQLVFFLETVAHLGAIHGVTVELTPDPEGMERLRAVALDLGYRSYLNGDQVALDRADGRRARNLRRVSAALGWDFPDLARRVATGERVVLTIDHDLVPAPLDLETWSSLVGTEVTPETALLELAKDQNLGYLIDGLEQVDASTREQVLDQHLKWLYQKAATPFYRYAPSVRLAEGRLQHRVQSEDSQIMTGKMDLKWLFAGDTGRRSYLWHAIYFAPPDVVAALRQTDTDGDLEPELSALAKADDLAIQTDRARGREVGVAALLRALSVDQSGDVALPGGARLWSEAIRSPEGSIGADDLERALERVKGDGRGRSRGEVDAIRQGISENRFDAGVVRRMVRGLGFFADHPTAISDRNVLLVVREADRYQYSLRVLDSLAPVSEETVAMVMLANARLDRSGRGDDDRRVIQGFQAGGETIRILATAGSVDRAVLEDLLLDWATAHVEADGSTDLARARLEWFVRLMSEMSPAAEAAPGRGPAERRFLAALPPFRDRQAFTWQGLDYEGERVRRFAEISVVRLVEGHVPSADQLLDLVEPLESVRVACDGDDVERLEVQIDALAAVVRQLPEEPVNAGAGTQGPGNGQRSAGVAMERIARIRLTGSTERARVYLTELESELDDRLVALLSASPYLEAMGGWIDLPFVNGSLIRRHTLTRGLTGPATADTPWMRAVLIPAERSGNPAHISGHVGGVGGAMVSALVAGAEGGSPYAAQNTVRDGWWYGNAVTRSWRAITPELSAAVSVILDLGDAAVEKAGTNPEHGELEASWMYLIPLARMEGALAAVAEGGQPAADQLSISERFMIGLAVAAQSGGAPAPEFLVQPLAAVEAATAGLGADWLSRLDVVGAPTPRLDGRGRPRLVQWPSYEAIEHEGPIDLIYERLLIDLRVSIIDFVGRHRLPGAVGRDLMRLTAARAPLEVVASGPRDWRAVLRWIVGLDDEYLNERMRQCLQDGLYRLRDF